MNIIEGELLALHISTNYFTHPDVLMFNVEDKYHMLYSQFQLCFG